MTKKQRENLLDGLRNASSIIDSMADDLTLDVDDDAVPKGKPYHYIVAWGLVMHSFGYYVSEQIVKARTQNAPEDAIYFSTESMRWVTFTDIKQRAARAQVDSYISVLTRAGA